MVLYTIVGLCALMYYLLSFEEFQIWNDDDYLKVFDDLNVNTGKLSDSQNSRSTLKSPTSQIQILLIPEEEKSKIQQISTQALNLAKKSIFRAIMGVLLWLFGFSVIFYLTEPKFTYFDSFYYTFVTITAIGFGDYQVTTPLAKELWWVFLFNAVSVLSYSLGVVGKIISIQLNEHDLLEQGMKYRKMLKNRLRKLRQRSFMKQRSFINTRDRRLSFDEGVLSKG